MKQQTKTPNNLKKTKDIKENLNILDKRIIIIFILFLVFVGIFFFLQVNDNYPVDLETIGKTISNEKLNRIKKNKNVTYREEGDLQTLKYINEVKVAGVPMLKTITIEKHEIISIGLGAEIQVNNVKPVITGFTQNVASCAEVEEKGQEIFNKLLDDAIEKHGKGYEYNQEPYDDLRN